MRKFLSHIVAFLLVISLADQVSASNHYTAKQLDALAERLGNQYWIDTSTRSAPAFYAEPAAGSATFRPANNESFEIFELVGQGNKTPYYKVKFQTGKIAYLRPETLHEEINGTIVSSDPLAEEKLKSAQQAEEEKQRIQWINAQPWPPALKEAAIKKQPSPGLTGGEVRQVLGPPRRIVKVSGLTKTRGPSPVHQERWFYPDGMVLLFHNQILQKVDRPKTD